MDQFTGVKVFSSTMHKDRAQMGEHIAAWLAVSKVRIIDKVVLQSSDDEYHCLSITLFYVEGL